MRLIFKDGTVQECLATSERQVATAEILVQPERAPKNLKLVWMTPPTYTTLAFYSCDRIQPGWHVMTAEGLKQVAAVKPCH